MNTSLLAGLKGSHLSFSEKLKLALVPEHQRNGTTAEILFDWVCQVMIRSVPKDVSSASSSVINEAAFCNRDCWKLLQTLLQLHRDRLTSKVPLCNLFIQFFKTALIDSIKCGALSNEPISLVDSSLLSCICECFFLSSSTELLQCKVLRPQFDQIVQLGQEAFVFSANYLSEQGVDLISIGLMSNILTVLERCLTSNNPKKCFTSIVSQLFAPMLTIRSMCFTTLQAPPSPFKNLVVQIDDMIRLALFESEHLIEMIQILNSQSKADASLSVIAKAQKNTSNSNYTSVFFRILEQWDFSVFKAYPVILSEFTMARSKAARANISISSSTVMSPEFLLFKKFQQGLVQQFEKAPSSQLMCILADLLKVVLDRNLYKPMNDSVSRDMMIYLKAQYSWILTTCTVIIDSGSSADLACLSYCLVCLDLFIQIDFDIANCQLSETMVLLSTPVPTAWSIPHSSSLVLRLFESYRKGGMLNVFVEKLVGNLKSCPENYTPLVVLSNGMTHLARTLSQSLSSEILLVFELASTELLAHFIPQYSYFYSSDSALLVSQEVEEGEARKEGEKNRRKRKKLESKTSKQVQSLFTLHPSHIIYILEMCLRHVHRLTPLQKNAFNQHSFSLYSRYVSCVIDFASDVDIVNHPVFMDRFLLPALRLHLKIIEVDSFYWENLNKLEVVQKVWNISSSLSMVKSLQIRLSLAHADRILSSMLSQSEELQAQTLVGNVLNTVDLFHNVRGYGNDGVADESKKKKKKKKKDSKKRQRESDDEEDTPVQEVIVKRTTSIEEWSAVLHALPVISRFASQTQIRSLLCAMFAYVESEFERYHVGQKPLTSPSSGDLMGLLAQVFQSAKFFEIRPIRDEFMVSYFDCLSRLFQNLFVNHHSSQGVSLFFKEIGGQSGKKPIDLKVIIKALELSHSSGTVSLTSLSSASISKMRGFTALLNLLPMAIYFSATERDAIIYRLVFVDILSFRVLFDFDSDPLIVESFIGFVASLRLLLLKAMQTRSDKLITLLSADLPDYFFTSGMRYYESCRKSDCQKESHVIIKTSFEIIRLTARNMFQKLHSDETETIAFFSSFISIIQQKPPGSSHTMQLWVDFVQEVVAASGKYEKLKSNGVLIGFVDQANLHLLKALDVLDSALSSGDVKPLLTKSDSFHIYLLHSQLYQSLMLFQISRSQNIENMALVLPKLLKLVPILASNFSDDVPEALLSLSASYLTCACRFGFQMDALSTPQAVCELVKMLLLMLKGGKCSRSICTDLENAFEVMLKRSNAVQFEGITAYIIQCLASVGSLENEVLTEVLIHMAKSMIKCVDSKGSRRLKKGISLLLINICQVARCCLFMSVKLAIVETMTLIISDVSIDIKSEELTLILQSVSVLNSPTWISRLSFAGMMPSKKEIETLFQSICRLLLAIVRMRKEEAINIIPAYFGFIKGLLHCFRATAEGIISVPPTEYGQKDSNQQQQQQSSCSYMGFWAPLSADCASSLARIFEQIPQKQTLKSTSLSASTYSESNFKHSDLKFTSIKPFAKHAIYLVAEYVAIQVSDQSIMSGLGNAKEPIVKGIYALLDLCGDHEIDYLLAALGHGSGKGGISGSLGFLSVSTVASLGSSFAVGKDAGRTLFKQLITDYKNKHKYIGK